jgi:Na+/melibiose symporter-like transporter
MRDFTRGELQAFSAAAKSLLFFGLFIAIFAGNDKEWLWSGVGVLMAVAGLTLGIWLLRYQKRTGKSAKPFGK